MENRTIELIGVPMDSGKRRQGCLMGPDALRTAGLSRALADLGHSVSDRGNISPAPFIKDTPGPLHALQETIAWTRALSDVAQSTSDTIHSDLHGRRSRTCTWYGPRGCNLCRTTRTSPLCLVVGCAHGLPHTCHNGIGQSAWHAHGICHRSPRFRRLSGHTPTSSTQKHRNAWVAFRRYRRTHGP